MMFYGYCLYESDVFNYLLIEHGAVFTALIWRLDTDTKLFMYYANK